jgi:hypothetical protein
MIFIDQTPKKKKKTSKQKCQKSITEQESSETNMYTISDMHNNQNSNQETFIPTPNQTQCTA